MLFNNIILKCFLITVLLFLSTLSKCQVPGSITLDPDFTVPSCQPCTTLHSTLVVPTASTNTYTVSQINYNPYSYSPGTVIPITGDDEWSDSIPLPFNFNFFCNTYKKFIAGTNGLISFNIAQANSGCPWGFVGVSPLPNTTYTSAFNSIMCPYQDLYPPAGGQISYQTYGTAPNRVFVVSFNVVPMFQAACNVLLNTQQIALYETTNVIETYIATKDLCTGWNDGQAIHGIENNGGTIAVIVPGRNLPSQWTATNDAWRFDPQSSAPTIHWTDVSNPNVILDSLNDTLTICPAVTTTYMAEATFYLCSGVQKDTDYVTVTVQPPVNATITNTKDVNCFGGSDGSFTVLATGGSNTYSYTYNGIPMNGPTQNGLPIGTYTIVVTDAFNCTGTTEVTINQPDELILTIAEQIDVKCKYQNTASILLNAIGGVPNYMYWWGNNTTTQNPEIQYLYAGNYTFYVADTHGCLDSVDTDILQPDSLLSVYLIPHMATCLDKHDGSVEAIASGGVPNYAYECASRPIQYNQTATNLETGVYQVLVTDANECITATQVAVEQEYCCQIFLPDAFSPNNDRNNDEYRIVERGGGVVLGEFKIYNRWGQEIFSTRDINTSWDGKLNGVDQNVDTYHYIIVYQCNDKGSISQKIKKGDFLLIR